MASLLKRSIAKGLQVKTLTFLQTGETRNVSIGLNLVLAGIVPDGPQGQMFTRTRGSENGQRVYSV